ncbi:MAG: glutamate-5-semialdehyde dehydrogenase [Gammaproteobacteria bacterium]
MNNKNNTLELDQILEDAQSTKEKLRGSSKKQKDKALEQAAESIDSNRRILKLANDEDMEHASTLNLQDSFIDRLKLDDKRIDSMISGLKKVIDLNDPVGETTKKSKSPSGFLVSKMRVPLGVIGIIYESRPNVTADASALCLKSGNACILRGGSEASKTNKEIEKCMIDGLISADLPEKAIQLLKNQDRALVNQLIKSEDKVDLIIPRGGKSLIKVIADDSKVPVLKHYEGLCHVFIDDNADLKKALDISLNAKVYRYGICGAMETLLVSKEVAGEFLPQMVKSFQKHDVELRGCIETSKIIKVKDAKEDDWKTEYLEPILSIKIVDGIDEAIRHINTYGSGHTDCIVTEDIKAKNNFLSNIDSSSVMHNLPTCYADGFEYGLGAEVGISTDKLHARGPVGLEGLTSQKFIVEGSGQLRE